MIQKKLTPTKDLKSIPLEADPEEYKVEQYQVNLRTSQQQLFESRQMWGRALATVNQLTEMVEQSPHYLLFSKAEYLAEQVPTCWPRGSALAEQKEGDDSHSRLPQSVFVDPRARRNEAHTQTLLKLAIQGQTAVQHLKR